jgi:hypothetical protein
MRSIGGRPLRATADHPGGMGPAGDGAFGALPAPRLAEAYGSKETS